MKKRTQRKNGTIYWREDRQKWCAQIVTGIDHETGKYKRKTLYGDNKDLLERQKRMLEAQVELGLYKQPTSHTVASWMDNWLKSIKSGIEPNTYSAYESISRVHIKPSLGKIQLEKLTGMQIQEMLDKKFAPPDGSKGLSKRSIRYIRQTLCKSLENAKEESLINSNPATRTKLPKQKYVKPRKKAFTAKEMRIFLQETANTSYYFLWLMAFMTGFRRGELLGLKWSDIDYDSCKIDLSRQVLREAGVPTVKEQLKTEGSSGAVIVIPLVLETLQEYRLKQDELLSKYGIKLEESDFIFCSHEKEPFLPDTVTKAFKRALRKCGLRDNLTLHGTRHTFATISTDINVNVKKLQQLLRHEDVNVTSEYIDKLEDESLRSEVKKINDKYASIIK